MKNTKTYLVLILLTFQNVYAGNTENPEILNNNYQIKERIFLDISKELFLAGEKIYFTVYCFDPSLEIKTGFSRIAYIEFFSQDNKPLQQVKVLMNNGYGSGYLEIPKKAATDYYFIRSYTNYMKNEGAGVFFKKRLKVINPFYNLQAESVRKEMIPDSVTILLFPESGNLIAGLPSKIAVRITGADGYYSYVNCNVMDRNNQIIIDSVKIDKNGFGYFDLTPEKNQKYIFNTKLGKYSFTAPLPEIRPYGIAMSVALENNESLAIELKYNNYKNYPLALVFEKNGINKTIRSYIYESVNKITIPVNELPGGIGQLHLKNILGEDILQRKIYVPFQKTISVQIKNDREFGTREEVEVKINTKNSSGLTEPANVNLCAYYLTDTKNQIIANPFYLEQLRYDIKRLLKIENYDLIEEIVHNKNEINKLLLFASDSEDKSVINKRMEFLPEIYGDIISGRVFNKKQAFALTNKRVYLSFLDTVSYLNITSTDSAGNFIFNLFNNPPCSNLIISIDDTSQNYSVDLDPEFYPYFSTVYKNTYIPGTNDKEKIRQAKINLQIEDLFSKGDTIRNTTYAKFDFYGFPTSKYLFHYYVDLPNLNEFVFEIVDGLKVKKRKQLYEFRIIQIDGPTLKEKPLFMIDGIPYFKNLSSIIKIKPAQLKSISLIEQYYFFGKYLFHGVVDIKSNEGDFGLIDWPETAFNFDYVCFQDSDNQKKIKYAIQDIENKRKPLYNNTLYWNSKILTNVDGEATVTFHTGDNKGEYLIRGTCITENGSIGYFTSRFEVK